MKTIEEAKEYFKNALIVKDTDGDIVDFSKVNINTMWKADSGAIYINNHKGNGVRLWSSKFGSWSERVEYTTPKEWKSNEVEFFNTRTKKWTILGDGGTKVRFKVDNSEKIAELERQIAELRC